nr:MAG TPA: hypothetical protein [Caudoviricetes sp.]
MHHSITGVTLFKKCYLWCYLSILWRKISDIQFSPFLVKSRLPKDFCLIKKVAEGGFEPFHYSFISA